MSRLDPRPLLPPGLVIEAVEVATGTIVITAHRDQGFGCCPACGGRSDRLHSLHRRRLLDLPSYGHAVELLVRVRRFRCLAQGCPRQTFTEPLSPGIVGRSGRRTSRLDVLVADLGGALGGRPAAALARRLMLPVAKDTLLRAVRRRSPPDAATARVIGIDDWAWRRRRRHGTVICDLERRRVVDLLPDRAPSAVKAWLFQHPGVSVVARDRAGGYAGAVAEAAPEAMQVADRWRVT